MLNYPKIIKTEADYKAALSHVDALMSAAPGTAEFDALELWVHLIEGYEAELVPIPEPDPISAIRFRMEQQGLKPADLIPYIGSKGRVSEVLSGKRLLTLGMIRQLNKGLGIPLGSLVSKEQPPSIPDGRGLNWALLPLREMIKRQWFGDEVKEPKQLLDQPQSLLIPYFSPILTLANARLRQSKHKNAQSGEYSLLAWKARVFQLAGQQQVSPFNPKRLNREFIKELGRLSVLDNGPLVAKDMLAKNGIRLVVEPRMPKTRLDGAAIWSSVHPPIIALTLRYDRLDNFWFTLSHELAHLVLHSKKTTCEVFLDDLEASNRSQEEVEADELASDSLIPKKNWIEFKQTAKVSKASLIDFASHQRIHVSIAAGRWRKETGNFRFFGDLLGRREVSRQFA